MAPEAHSPTDPPKAVPGEAVDRLFHGPLEEFTSARNELAKSLRSEGTLEAADWVKGLKKPTRAAWLVNQLAVRKPKEVAKLLEAGADLRRAQEEMLAGAPDREALRKAARREQEAVDWLARTAEAIGREHKAGFDRPRPGDRDPPGGAGRPGGRASGRARPAGARAAGGLGRAHRRRCPRAA